MEIMKRLKAICYILTCNNFFLASYYDGFNGDYDTVKYIHPKFNQYFADCIKKWINDRYDKLPKFK